MSGVTGSSADVEMLYDQVASEERPRQCRSRLRDEGAETKRRQLHRYEIRESFDESAWKRRMCCLAI